MSPESIPHASGFLVVEYVVSVGHSFRSMQALNFLASVISIGLTLISIVLELGAADAGTSASLQAVSELSHGLRMVLLFVIGTLTTYSFSWLMAIAGRLREKAFVYMVGFILCAAGAWMNLYLFDLLVYSGLRTNPAVFFVAGIVSVLLYGVMIALHCVDKGSSPSGFIAIALIMHLTMVVYFMHFGMVEMAEQWRASLPRVLAELPRG